ncbi:hypothetical protein FZ999_22505, partial [Salmonella enterica subsp. enterica serovar Typhimurium]
ICKRDSDDKSGNKLGYIKSKYKQMEAYNNCFFFQAEVRIPRAQESRGLRDLYKKQILLCITQKKIKTKRLCYFIKVTL